MLDIFHTMSFDIYNQSNSPIINNLLTVLNMLVTAETSPGSSEK